MIKGKNIIDILRKFKHEYEIIIYRIFSLFPVNQHRILFESEDDFSDNSFALFDYMKKNGFFKKYEPIWLISHPVVNIDLFNGTCIAKWNRSLGLKRAYYLATSKYYIFDHSNVFSSLPVRKHQVLVNLWHGCPFKSGKGKSTATSNKEEMVPSTSDFWKEFMALFLLCDINKVQSLGFPRNDYFFNSDMNLLQQWMHEKSWTRYKKIIFWMPTFRKSNNVTISENYFEAETGLPIVNTIEDMLCLNSVLKSMDSLMVFKVHHLQAECNAFNKKYSNIQILKDEDILKKSLQLYQIISLSDALITDYSSISNDYLLLDRPIIFTLDDYEEYKRSRGFTMDDPIQYFPGHHVYNKAELFSALQMVLSGKDLYKKERNKVRLILHKFRDGNSSQRILDYIGIRK